MQEHSKQGRPVHWDLMLESGGVLQTYRLVLPPGELLHQRATAVKIFDHPLKFLTYEGSLSEDKGSVQIADGGTYRLLRADTNLSLLKLDGKILKGKFALARIEADRWEFYLLKSGRSGST